MINEIRYQAFSFKCKMHEFKESFYRWLAWKLPHRLMFWAFMRGVADCTTGKWETEDPDRLSVMTAIDRLGSSKK